MRKMMTVVAGLLILAGSVGAAEVADLVAQMKSRSTDDRRSAARELGQQEPSEKVVEALLVGLKDRDFFVRRFSAQSLGKLGSDAKASVPALANVLKNSRERKEVIEAAIKALGSMGEDAVEPLADVVKDTKAPPVARSKAAKALGNIGPKASAAVPALTEAMKAPRRRRDMSMDIRVDVVTALGKIASAKDEETVKTLTAMTMERIRDRTLRDAMGTALRAIKKRK